MAKYWVDFPVHLGHVWSRVTPHSPSTFRGFFAFSFLSVISAPPTTTHHALRYLDHCNCSLTSPYFIIMPPLPPPPASQPPPSFPWFMCMTNPCCIQVDVLWLSGSRNVKRFRISYSMAPAFISPSFFFTLLSTKSLLQAHGLICGT